MLNSIFFEVLKLVMEPLFVFAIGSQVASSPTVLP